ncbi:MAG: cyclase family protein [Pseudomonadota bacterium]
MCDPRVIDTVKRRMLKERPLSRRRLLQRSACAMTAGVTACGASSAVTAPGSARTVEDMTYELHREFPTYFGVPGFEAEHTYNYAEHRFNLFNLRLNEHTGTHVDAPLHFSGDGLAVHEIPVNQLVVPLCVIDIAARAADDADAQVTPDDITAYISRHGPLPRHACVAMYSGWGRHVTTKKYRNEDLFGAMHFPGFHREAVEMLMDDTEAVALAVDTLSLDHGKSRDLATHYAWLPTNRYGIENLANLENVPASGATLVVGAPKHRGGSGGPARIFAFF